VDGLLGHSYALIADAIESMADIFASVVVWGGLRISAQPADAEHPYGHGRAEPLAALIVSLMLFGAAIGITIEAIREIVTPHHAPEPFTLWILGAVILIKEVLFRFVHRVAIDVDSGAVMADAWHHRSDAITSAAAAVGISIALIGGRGYESADDWAALVAAAIIAINAWRLLMRPLHELMDRVPPDVIDQVAAVAARVPGVGGVEKVLARKHGMQYLVDMHLEVDPDMSVRDSHALAHDVKNLIQRELPHIQDVLIHIEPLNEPAPQPAFTVPPVLRGDCGGFVHL
jgi:cation diffusion facilitator family transporter